MKTQFPTQLRAYDEHNEQYVWLTGVKEYVHDIDGGGWFAMYLTTEGNEVMCQENPEAYGLDTDLITTYEEVVDFTDRVCRRNSHNPSRVMTVQGL